ncbi:MAG: HlyD family efflux transporter periplasmic adaptor subunit [Planctomycetota bacterium]|nr:HlyD family efflux transporter periplasmic adaptor subunit [Planctomycetota bacterium]
MTSRQSYRGWLALAALLALAVLMALGKSFFAEAIKEDPRVAVVERRDFVQNLTRTGILAPVSQQIVMSKVNGTLQEIVADGSRVAEGDALFLVDPKPHQEQLVQQEAKMRRVQAEWVKEREELAKELRKAQGEAQSRELKLNLEALRLKELQLGPSASDELEAQNQLANAKNLFQALSEERDILASLAEDGFVSFVEVRQKDLDTTEQRLKVRDAEIKLAKLHLPDAVKLAEQKLKVQVEEKALERANQRVTMLAENMDRAKERFEVRWKREEQNLSDCRDNLANTKHLSPIPGIAMIRSSWGIRYGPGREVGSGRDVLTLADLRHMKVQLTVDEGRIAYVRPGQQAKIRVAGLQERVFSGSVVRVAEKGRDEFEALRWETREFTGQAERQVFDIEVEIAEEADVLRPGLRVEVDLELQRYQDVLVVPRAALVREKDICYVRKTAAGGPERVQVEPRLEDRLYAVVNSEELKEGDRVWLVAP